MGCTFLEARRSQIWGGGWVKDVPLQLVSAAENKLNKDRIRNHEPWALREKEVVGNMWNWEVPLRMLFKGPRLICTNQEQLKSWNRIVSRKQDQCKQTGSLEGRSVTAGITGNHGAAES